MYTCALITYVHDICNLCMGKLEFFFKLIVPSCSLQLLLLSLMILMLQVSPSAGRKTWAELLLTRGELAAKFQLRKDLQKVWKQGRDENEQEDYPTVL